MRARVLILALLIGSFAFYGAESTRTQSQKFWVFFSGRPYLRSGKLPSAQWGGFTPASIQRREVRGTGSWEPSDFPVDTHYVRALRSAGAMVLQESRWLNAVSVFCDENCRSQVRSFPFVASVRGVAVYHRPIEQIQTVSAAVPLNSVETAAPSLQYGNSLDQLVQLKVPAAHSKGFAGQGEIVAIFDSGFRKDHVAFKDHVIIAEHDFVFGDDDVSNGVATDSHGTGTWSCVGGAAPGILYGPAYQAKFILAATEDVPTETRVEEDNWVAAFEWADRLGAGVISSSLGYSDWYSQSDFDGTTPTTSRVASTAARKGILVVNSAGNEGPNPSTLVAPADAKDILAVGAVGSSGLVAGFSSRGPTADGRIKPEVVARGVQTWLASSDSSTSFGRASGTSFSCPLTAGFSAVLLSAHPDWKPLQVREAVMMSANLHNSPDNTFGYGIPNMALALDYLPAGSVVIDHKPLSDTTNNSQPYRVIARIRAQQGLKMDQLFLFWKREGASTFTRVALLPVAGAVDRFTAAIPPQSHGSAVNYYLVAKDVKGKVSKAPFHAPQNLFRFQVL